MSPAFKRCLQERLDDGQRLCLCNEPHRQGQHIGIVVLSGQGSQFFSPTQSGPDALMFIGRHGYAVAAAAHNDPQIGISSLYAERHRMYKIGVINRILGMGAKIQHFHSERLQQQNDGSFVGKAGVIATDGNR